MSIISHNPIGYTTTFTIDQKSEWIDYVNRAVEKDFYHSWHYHSLANNGSPVLFVYGKDIDFIALPLLKREIPNTSYCDLHSVYGYSGPISNISSNNIPKQLIDGFKDAFIRYLKHHNVISVFSKLHPFFNQKLILENFSGIYDNGITVAIDLQTSLEIQRKRYRQTTSDAIKRCGKLGFRIKESTSQEDIVAFTSLYKKNMRRINAAEFYHFNEDYFTNLLKTDEYQSKLILVYDEDKIICGSIIMCNHGIIQGHLIATNTDYLRYSPAKFLVDEVSILGRHLGMDYYHLGGGLGFKENSLLDWKLGFSDFVLNYKSWRFIANPDIYNHLVKRSGHSLDDTIDFFPLYRM